VTLVFLGVSYETVVLYVTVIGLIYADSSFRTVC